MVEKDVSLAIQILQSMTVINNDIFPQETGQELFIVHTNLVRRHNHWKGRTGIGSSFECFPPLTRFAFS